MFIWNYFFEGISENIDERTKQLKKIKDEKNKLKVILLYGQLFLSFFFTVGGMIICRECGSLLVSSAGANMMFFFSFLFLLYLF